MACPGVDTMAQMVCQILPPAAVAPVEVHLSDCRDCRALLATLATSVLTRPAAPRALPSPDDDTAPRQRPVRLLLRGDHLDRFTIRECLGAGGMGIVYAAHDPQLDREVALKILRPGFVELTGDGARELLLAEAQTMARLHHPNVITVHEVGTAGDAVFIAMALCRGGTLRGWLRDERTLPEILAVLLDAGRGLAAAHRAGLVHRDFKPDYVLLDDTGRACVSDFGLARPSGTDDGELAGTPAYMAPEQRAGAAPDARADQYAFCLVAREALGQRTVPRGLTRAIDRGLSPDPDDRHPSMDALVTLLARDWQARRRLIAAGALAAAVAGTTAAVIAMNLTTRGAEPACIIEPASHRVWTRERSAQLQARFAASGVPYAADTAQRVIERLDDWSGRWGTIDAAGCRGTRNGTLTTSMRGRQTVCLQRQLGEVRALIDVFAEADAAVVERAVAAVERVTAIDSCEDVVALSAAVLPPPADQKSAVDTVRDRVAGARALQVAGRARQALAIAEPAAASARATGYRAVEAEALVVLGALHHDLDDDVAAERDLRAAIAAAEAAADDHLRAEALIELGYVLQVGERTAELDHLLAATRALVERLHDDPVLAADVAALAGNLLNARGDYAGALEHFRAALVGRLALGERAGTSVASSRHAAGITLNRLGRYAEAVVELEAAFTALVGVLGVDHPRVADVRHDIAQTMIALGRLDDARGVLQRVLATRVALLGESHSDVARTRADLALVLIDLGRPDDARRELDAAITALTATLGPEHSDVVVAITYRGDLEALHGDPARGLADYQRAIDLTERHHGPDHPRLGDLYGRKADVLRHLERYPEAIAAAQHAHDVRSRGLAPDDPLLAYGLHALGVIHLDAGDARKALPLLERAMTLRAAAGDALDPLELATSRFAVARALRELGRDASRAAELARAAREGFAVGPRADEMLAEVDAFLKN